MHRWTVERITEPRSDVAPDSGIVVAVQVGHLGVIQLERVVAVVGVAATDAAGRVADSVRSLVASDWSRVGFDSVVVRVDPSVQAAGIGLWQAESGRQGIVGWGH